jgi:hypothetical protein
MKFLNTFLFATTLRAQLETPWWIPNGFYFGCKDAKCIQVDIVSDAMLRIAIFASPLFFYFPRERFFFEPQSRRLLLPGNRESLGSGIKYNLVSDQIESVKTLSLFLKSRDADELLALENGTIQVMGVGLEWRESSVDWLQVLSHFPLTENGIELLSQPLLHSFGQNVDHRKCSYTEIPLGMFFGCIGGDDVCIHLNVISSMVARLIVSAKGVYSHWKIESEAEIFLDSNDCRIVVGAGTKLGLIPGILSDFFDEKSTTRLFLTRQSAKMEGHLMGGLIILMGIALSPGNEAALDSHR